MKRWMAILLTLALLLGLALPVYAHNSPDCVLTPYSTTLDATVIKGGEITLQFFNETLYRISEASTIRIEIYKGDMMTFLDGGDMPLVETRTYHPSDFGSDYSLGMTWVADSRYSVGDYTLVSGLVNEAGEIPEQIFFLVELHVLASPSAASDIALLLVDDDYNSTHSDPIVLRWNELVRLVPVLLPIANTTKRSFALTGYEKEILGVAQLNMHGYPEIKGNKIGVSDLTVDYGTIQKTFRVIVTLDGLCVSLTPKRTNLCIGQTDVPKPVYTTNNADGTVSTIPESKVYPIWKSSNEAVVSVKDGVVTANGSGTATVTIVAGTAAQSVEYTVHPHDLPADAPTVVRTATRPGYTEGTCSLCGQANARNYTPAVFADTDADAWYADAVDYVYDKGIMKGITESLYSPRKTLTRAQLVTVLYRLVGSPEAPYQQNLFADVSEGQYYTEAVMWAAANDIVKGVGDGRFNPSGSITREQIAVILHRYCGSPKAEGSLEQYPDADKVSGYASDAMVWATSVGLINGIKSGDITSLAPKSTATRAQIASILQRLCEAVLKEAPQA